MRDAGPMNAFVENATHIALLGGHKFKLVTQHIYT